MNVTLVSSVPFMSATLPPQPYRHNPTAPPRSAPPQPYRPNPTAPPRNRTALPHPNYPAPTLPPQPYHPALPVVSAAPRMPPRL